MSGKEKAKIISNDPAEDIAPISPYGAVEYSINAEALAKLAKQSAGIKTVNSAKDVAAIMPYIAALRDKRVALDKERKVMKEGAIAHGKLVESEANTLIKIIQPEEQRLQAIRKKFEDIAAAEKQKKIEAEVARKAYHRTKIQAISDLPGQLIADKASAKELSDAIRSLNKIDRSEYEDFADQAEGAIDTAISVIGMAFDLAEKADAQAKIDLENSAETSRLNEEKRKVAEKQEANEKEAKRLEQQEADQAAKVESDKQAAAQKIIDDKAAAEQAEIDKKASAKAEKKRKADIEKAAPDAEKLSQFAQTLRELAMPALDTDHNVVTWIEQDIETLATKIVDTANGMIS